MLPLQPAMNPLDDGFRRGPLRALRSTNRTDAAGWPALGALAGAGGDALRALERAPPALLPAEFGARDSKEYGTRNSKPRAPPPPVSPRGLLAHC